MFKKKNLGFLLVAIVFLVLWFLPSEVFGMDGLTQVQQRIIAIFAYATLMWVLELVPAWATSVSIMVLLLLCASDSGFKWMCDPSIAGQLLSYKQVMASFADPVVMLFIGGFVLAIATTKTGLDVHLARVLLTPFGKKSENILLGFMLVTALFSMFISNTATTAMMLTFLGPVFKQLPEAGKGRIAMALSVPIAANIGGMGTPIGTPPNTIALKYLNDPESLNLGIGFPLSIVFALLLNEMNCLWAKKMVQTVSYMPYFISIVVLCGLITEFCSTQGTITNFLVAVFGIPRENLLTNPDYFWAINLISDLWQNLG